MTGNSVLLPGGGEFSQGIAILEAFFARQQQAVRQARGHAFSEGDRAKGTHPPKRGVWVRHRDFPEGHPFQYYSCPQALNCGVLMGSGVVAQV